MGILWLFHDYYYQKLPLEEKIARPITIGPDFSDTLTVQSFPFTDGALEIIRQDSGLSIRQGSRELGRLNGNEPFRLNEGSQSLSLFYTADALTREAYYIGSQKEITLSEKERHGHIIKTSQSGEGSFALLKTAGGWTVSPEDCRVYRNGIKLSGQAELKVGDILLWPFMELRLIDDDLIEITGIEDFETSLPHAKQPKSEMSKIYPLYRRTPRMVYELPEDKVSLSFPSQEGDDHNRGLWMIILPPLMMLIVMGIVALISPRGIFIIVSMVMFITTLVTSTVQYFKDKSLQKKRKERRRVVYTRYLETKRQELQDLAEKQRHFLTFHFPSFERMKYLTAEISDRLWERTPESVDFLEFRLGKGKVPSSYHISLSSSDMSNREIDDLLEQSQQMERVYREIDNVPVIANLSKGAVGLVGKPSVVKKEIHQIIGQLSFFHSYHDVRFVFIFDEKEYPEWEWMKWLPHFQLPHAHAKGFIYNDQTRDQLLSSIYEIIRDRDMEEDKEKKRFMPHLVFIVSNQQLIADHVILEYLEGNHSGLGISVIFAAEAKESLSDNINTLVRYINDNDGDILIQGKKAVQKPFKLDEHLREGNENFARMLRTLDHQVGMTNSIPTSVSFLEMFNTMEVSELPIMENWQTRESSKSLAVPIGLKGKNDLVELNLHEKAHGPHGLLAGTTGSGKSEFLQTYILSLAVHFHPHEVAFLLIDYKGGGMAQPFKEMPHLLGTITNIEGSKNFSERALASIKSELKRRQRLFDRYVVNHINDYTDLYKQGKAEEPLPHLFLISDEFAELKSEEPEFIRELVSAARIGRSLGVHLILATQKPGGVIDNQIWSNARFKVALKVQDAEDSREILKNSDASNITVTGRGYLQVGNNEVYELFQSAWSGAPYLEETFEAEDEVAIVTDLGLIPLSGVASREHKKKEKVTHIEAVVDEIEAVQAKMGIVKLRSPWLPPLSERIFRSAFANENKDEILLGMIDEPEKQSQSPFSYSVMEDGNLGIFGSSGYGKSFTALTLLLGIAEKYSPEEAQYYIMDFGNGSLLPLRQLPHTADYFLMDEERKIEKFMRVLKDEIARRKQMFQREEVSGIKMFNTLSDEKLPLIFITIDNFDLVKEEMMDLESQINQLARDGQSLGIYMIFTATRANAIRQSLMNNLKTKIVHYLLDQTESYSILGTKAPFVLEAMPGRAIVKKEQAYFSQVFLPAEGKDDYELMEGIKYEVELLKKKYDGFQEPAPVPMLPAELNTVSFARYTDGIAETGVIPIGLDEEMVQPVCVDFVKTKHLMVLGQAQKGKTNLLKVVLDTAMDQGTDTIAVFDAIDRGLSSYASEPRISYVETKEQISSWLDTVEQQLAEREKLYLESLQHGGSLAGMMPILLVIDGYTRFLQQLDSMMQERVANLMRNSSHLGFNIVVSGNHNELSKGYDSLTSELKQIRQAAILMKKSEQTMFTLAYSRKEDDIHPGFGYYVLNGKETKIQIPLSATERKVHS
ncbi:type VII secretion protein EssC [Mesobacillus zeae]|uniref:Type VII secretion protein EssC n=1 Tax=Mesobacillus zeae TaxID=1917180 RepID=A0A398AWE1_9BACI|nr:type VII secretion protein EssC [Mesobacillus zeae]RID81905.1 type VII secretion protein EssC [Mesobacillus zeae]